MGQQFKQFRDKGFSTAIDDFEMTAHGAALAVGAIERERFRSPEAHEAARARLVREAVAEGVIRVRKLEGEEHATRRANLIRHIVAHDPSPGFREGDDKPHGVQIDGHIYLIRRDGWSLVVWRADEPAPPVVRRPAPEGVVSADAEVAVPDGVDQLGEFRGFETFEVIVHGAAAGLAEISRERITLEAWREKETCEAVIDGGPVFIRRCGYRFQVWAPEASSPPAVTRTLDEGTGTLDDYEVVVLGTGDLRGARDIGLIDRTPRERSPEEHAAERLGLLTYVAAMAGADRWEDGRMQPHLIDGVPCMLRRDGWRITFWGEGEGEPAVDRRAMPEGGDPIGMEVREATIAFADVNMDGSPRVSLKPIADARKGERDARLQECIAARRASPNGGTLVEALEAAFVRDFT